MDDRWLDAELLRLLQRLECLQERERSRHAQPWLAEYLTQQQCYGTVQEHQEGRHGEVVVRL